MQHQAIDNVANTESDVVAWALKHLIEEYGYPAMQIKTEVLIDARSHRRADIVVYADVDCVNPLIVVECKNYALSAAYFLSAAHQARTFATAIRAKFIWVTTRHRNSFYFCDDSAWQKWREVANLPRFGVSRESNYRYGYNGGVDAQGNRVLALIPLSQDELQKRLQASLDIIWSGGAMNGDDAFNEMSKLIFCKISDEQKVRRHGEAYDFQLINCPIPNGDAAKSLLSRINQIHAEICGRLPQSLHLPLRITPSQMKAIADCLSDVSITGMESRARVAALDEFVHDVLRRSEAQSITPRSIVDFAVRQLPFCEGSNVLDLMCGVGGFLANASQKENIKAFGLEVQTRIVDICKVNMLFHDLPSGNIGQCDGLLPITEIATITKCEAIKKEGFDFVFTHPPFGIKIGLSWRDYINEYEISKNGHDRQVSFKRPSNKKMVNVELLCIEQGWRFLRSGGWMVVILPDGILSSASLRYAREWIMIKFRIVAIVALPLESMKEMGSNVRCSMVFMRKRSIDVSEKISEERGKYLGNLMGCADADYEMSNQSLSFIPNENVFVSTDDDILNSKSEAASKLSDFINRINNEID